MALLHDGITMIHFDETYHLQTKLSRYAHDNINFMDLEHTNLFCGRKAFHTIKARLGERKQKGITFLGSGNYHYVTYILLQEITEPFTLVLFDNHTDLVASDEKCTLLSCGSWVSFALKKIPLLKQVIIIGPTSVQSHQTRLPRVTIYPFNIKHPYYLKSVLSSIHTEHIYISIDKDVLNTFEAETNWDQGAMDLQTLTQYLKLLFEKRDVEGVDICGESKISTVSQFLPDFQRTIKKNENANLMILRECLNSSSKQTKGA